MFLDLREGSAFSCAGSACESDSVNRVSFVLEQLFTDQIFVDFSLDFRIFVRKWYLGVKSVS